MVVLSFMLFASKWISWDLVTFPVKLVIIFIVSFVVIPLMHTYQL